MSAGASGWTANAQGVSAAAAGTAKTVLKVLAPANRLVKITDLIVGFVSGSATSKNVLVELCQSTEAGAGSGSSAVTPVKVDGSNASTVQATAGKGYTGEPTTLTTIYSWRVHPQGAYPIQLPLGREVVSDIAKAICVRVTFETGETTSAIDVTLGFEE